CQQGHSYPLTF
nr:immunoglobulin light chain junction region [Macaca mulatta]MOV78698.1 immunoglobulin light chain junction region [Macaca mulatta]MOV83254.1 immunoglobulin light chain junction region [Macaca mulatta]MOV85491.1 immunoglobulin light chain junction region [Macaca mulatta]